MNEKKEVFTVTCKWFEFRQNSHRVKDLKTYPYTMGAIV